MYPIDIPHLIRRGTLGSHALDPTFPCAPPRRLGTHWVLAAGRRATRGRAAAAATRETASTASS